MGLLAHHTAGGWAEVVHPDSVDLTTTVHVRFPAWKPGWTRSTGNWLRADISELVAAFGPPCPNCGMPRRAEPGGGQVACGSSWPQVCVLTHAGAPLPKGRW